MKMTSAQFEAIISAMFMLENEIDEMKRHLEKDNIEKSLKDFAIYMQMIKQKHYDTFKQMIEGN